ncbi:hypothetical protein [Verminephrobacter eiseniae]|uniref:hypothetical protein n=1 Tax=Verminephrobacter eiseniae TaxID=364317 RepID=UPI002238FA4D|nr:hypothetical protein [Verminephrobacter eiseniae]
MPRHRSSVGLRWPSKRIAALHRLPIRSVWAARCALRCAPMAARSLRHLIRDTTRGRIRCTHIQPVARPSRHQARRHETPKPTRWSSPAAQARISGCGSSICCCAA